MTLDDGSRADLWAEVLTVADAEVMASHGDGTPAVTRNGTAWYVATRLDEAATAALAGGSPTPRVYGSRRARGRASRSSAGAGTCSCSTAATRPPRWPPSVPTC